MTKPNLPLIFKNAFIIYLVATTINLVILFIAQSMGFSLKGTSYESFSPVVLYASSFVFSLIGTIVFFLVYRFVKKQPAKLYRILGYSFLILNALPLLGFGIGNLEKIYFEVAHLVLGVPFIEYMIRGYHTKSSENHKSQS